ncbi:hypothetical protein GCM10023187_37500 [Nibrella viscosa]|uniref:Uncharacterized protein n=1 Tax=Nibrella viscosa TaxID=1084524 RepID=A0ABP8KQ43_9BACT
MKDKLERFIRDNREDFDVFEPRLDLWKDIEQGLEQGTGTSDASAGLAGASSGPGGKVRPLYGRSGFRSRQFDWRVAAAITLLMLTSGFLYLNHQYGIAKQPEVVAINPAYASDFVQYTRLIDAKRAELKQLTESNPALYQQFATDLERLENSYKNLKADLPKNPNQEVLIQAMIQNLQLQIDLLNQQLNVIQRIKNQEKPSNENIM